MNTVNIQIHTDNIINSKVAGIMRDSFTPFSAGGDFGIGCSIAVDDDDQVEISQDAFVWSKRGAEVVMESLHAVDIDVKMEYGGPSYAILSNEDLGSVVQDIYAEMISDQLGSDTGNLIAMQGGFLIMSGNPAISMFSDSAGMSQDRLTDKIAARHFRGLVDASASSHTRLVFTQQVTAFASAMINQIVQQHGKPEIEAFFKETSLTATFLK